MILMLGAYGVLCRTNYGSFVNQLLEFPSEQGMLTSMYAQVREEEQVISLQFVSSQQDVSNCRKKKRKQVDGAATA